MPLRVTRTRSVVAAATRLRAAAASGVPCAPVRDLIGRDDVATAYAVQQLNLDERYRAGRRRIGRKIGLTSEAVQRQLGVDAPDIGALLDDMAVPAGGRVPSGRLLQPRVEAEVAFWLGGDLLDEPVDLDDVRSAVAGVAAAIEIVDSRVADWDISLADTVADNASSGMFVVSENARSLADVNPVDVRMRLRRGEEVVSAGDGRACLGDPLAALRWLAAASARLGDPLRAGEVVLSGALGPMVAAAPGDCFVAELTGLGSVAVGFTGEASGGRATPAPSEGGDRLVE